MQTTSKACIQTEHIKQKKTLETPNYKLRHKSETGLCCTLTGSV